MTDKELLDFVEQCTFDVMSNGVNNAKWGKPWVSLTDEEARWLYNNHQTPSKLIEAVEAKLKEKNT